MFVRKNIWQTVICHLQLHALYISLKGFLPELKTFFKITHSLQRHNSLIKTILEGNIGGWTRVRQVYKEEDKIRRLTTRAWDFGNPLQPTFIVETALESHSAEFQYLQLITEFYSTCQQVWIGDNLIRQISMFSINFIFAKERLTQTQNTLLYFSLSLENDGWLFFSINYLNYDYHSSTGLWLALDALINTDW